ncbi:MAG: Gfo/Idh/MocA family oxidoreductase [Candidatus Paceibacterota bacterium]|jgi:predicted dehydrogenase
MSSNNSKAREMPAVVSKPLRAPKLHYQPRKPKHYRPRIGLIGCGGITKAHLTAYKKMGCQVVALCDIREEAARERQKEFYPKADIITNHHVLLDRKDIDVVDIATHPAVRVAQIEDALNAGKHVLSQKPFVLDLEVGKNLVALAKRKNLKLAVNQNGRWAPYFSYARELAKSGHLGEITSVDMTLAWNHTWIKGTAFERLHQVVLYDFAIHWFDMVACLFGERQAIGVFASLAKSPDQTIEPPMNAHALVSFNNGQATMSFHAHTISGNIEHLLVTGTKGLYQATGPICAANEVRLITAKGESRPTLKGAWFPDGMVGAMGELLCAIEEKREPENSAANNLRSIALCFAAMESSRSGRMEIPGKILEAGPGCSTE